MKLDILESCGCLVEIQINIMASNLMVQIILSGKSVSSLHSIKLVTAKIELD